MNNIEQVSSNETKQTTTKKKTRAKATPKSFPVLSYNKFSKILFYKDGDKTVQLPVPDYDGSGMYTPKSL